MMEPFLRCHQGPVVLSVLQFTGDYRDEVNEKRMWSKGDHARLSTSILVVDWLLEFDGRPTNDCFVHLVAVFQAFVDRFVPVSKQPPVPVWIKGPLHCLAREKAAR